MERLTERTVDSFGVKRTVLKDPTKKSLCTDCKYDCESCSFKRAIDRLAAYEYTRLEPEEIQDLMVANGEKAELLGDIGHIRNLLAAEQDGRLVVLPCKVGGEVYTLMSKSEPVKVEGYRAGKDGKFKMLIRPYRGSHCLNEVAFDQIGKTVFLTRAEAEAALRGEER